MRGIILTLFLGVFFGQKVSGQRLIEIHSTLDAQGNYLFTCNNNAFCNYILEVSFPMLENLRSDRELPFRSMVKPGSNKLFKLTKIDRNIPERFNYRISYARGCIDPQVNPDFVYLLPYAAGMQTQAYEMETMTNPAASSQPLKDFYAIRFRMKPGDTIYAARRGVVSDIQVGSGLNDSGMVSTHEENYIEIFHSDCSFGHYGVLRKNAALVKLGQLVEAGDPIGLVGGDKFGRGADIKFSVYYNGALDSAVVKGNQAGYTNWIYVTIQFWTKQNGKGKLRNGALYVAEKPDSLVTKEMTKAEITRWKTSHQLAGPKTKSKS